MGIEEHLQVLGITQEEWDKIKLPTLIIKFTKAKKELEKQKMPSEVKDKLIMTVNESYDKLRTAIVTKTKKLRKEDEEEQVIGKINYSKLETKVNLPPGLQHRGKMKPQDLPVPNKFIDKGIVINPKILKIPMDKTELVVPAKKEYGDTLVYTDLVNISLLHVSKC